MTLFELILRSMRKNIKSYYLYFFSFIFSSSLYFIFANLRYDDSLVKMATSNFKFSTSFKVAGILLFVIIIVFTLYANYIFLKRRSKEIGLYQLIGLTKTRVSRLLIIENILLGFGALVFGILSGALLSRLFLLILAKLVEYDGFITINFSSTAFFQTIAIFTLLMILTSIQILLVVYRNTLLGLFNADKKEEMPKKTNTFISITLTLFGLCLIGYGYWLSGNMINEDLLRNMLVVLASTILGTYLLFRISMSLLFYQLRKKKNGYLGIKNSLSIAPIMHQIKSNANSLTLITVLSAMTLTMVAVMYSLYYSAEADTRVMMPYNFVFENREKEAKSFITELNKQDISFVHHPFTAVRLMANRLTENAVESSINPSLFLSAEQLRADHPAMDIPKYHEAVLYNSSIKLKNISEYAIKGVTINNNQHKLDIKFSQLVPKQIINFTVKGTQLVVSNETLNDIKKFSDQYEQVRMDTIEVPNKKELAIASNLYKKYTLTKIAEPDFYEGYKSALEVYGIFIFIGGFLGLAFLISTGSILYFKQMTEAEQGKKSYLILHQIGFDIKSIMSGIIRKQILVFSIPLIIGIFHSIFAVKVVADLLTSSIVFPAAIAMGLYTLIYAIFAILTITYYKKIVKMLLQDAKASH